MKKLFAVLLVLLMAAPAIAADWNFYGSSRVSTFYTGQDRPYYDNQDIDLGHSLQGNSRFGANVKADKVSGKVEFGLRTLDGSNRATADDEARTRLIYGDWNFADKSYLRVGKQLSILDFTDVSNQVYNGDNDLSGMAPAGTRTTAVTLKLSGLEVSLVQPKTTDNYAANTEGNDAKFPKLEAIYGLNLDKFTFKVGGGYQYLEVKPAGGTVEDIQSYILQAQIKAAFGALYLGGAGFYGQNVDNAGWSQQTFGSAGQAFALQYARGNFDAATGDYEDATTYGAGGAVGLNFTDTIAFEVGAGFRADETDLAVDSDASSWLTYAQMTYKIAPGFKITPEVGYISNQDDFGTGRSNGWDWYAGLQWRIDF